MRSAGQLSPLPFCSYFLISLILLLFFPSSLWALEGAEKWSFKTGSGIISSPAIDPNGTIYVGSSDHHIYALNPDGSLVWQFSGPSAGVTSSPAIGPNGTVYAGSYDYHLYAINEDGTLKWVYDTGGQINASPAIGSDGTIYIGSEGAGDAFRFHAIHPDGTAKWTFDCPVAWSSPAIGLDGTIYVGSTDGHLYAIYPDGRLKWTFAAGDFIYASPAIGKDETIYIGSNNGRLYAIMPDGSQKWVFETGGVNFNSFFSPAIGPEGTIYAGSNYPNNNLYAINPDGTLKWAFDTGEIYLSTPAISKAGTIYVGSKRKKLFAINSDGSLKWEFETQGFVESSPVIGTDGTVYIGSTDTYVYAVEGAPGGLAASSWPMYRSNIHHTGNPDADADGLLDYWEYLYFFDLSKGSLGDADSDGLRNQLEFEMGLNPADSDTDDDGMSDGWEVTHSFDPHDNDDAAQDADDDGITNLDEYLNGYDPNLKAPAVQLTVDPSSGPAPLTAAFQAVAAGEVTDWHWDFGDGTSGSGQSPTHTYVQTGTFTVQLTGVGPGGEDAFSATVESVNTPPVADAGPDQTLDEGTQVKLNGGNSHDPNSNMAAYRWEQLNGPLVEVDGEDTIQAVFTAPDVGPDGAVLNFQLTVTDSDGLANTDTCTIHVAWINQPPIADAGPKQTAGEGTQVTLNGSGSSDPDDGVASMQWVQTRGPTVALSDPSATDPTFTAPDVGPAGTTLSFTLTVKDANGLHAEDTCQVAVTWINEPPAADAGPDQTVEEGKQVVLNGSGSYDTDDGIGHYQWTQMAGANVQLSDPSFAYPAFTAPDVGPGGDVLIFQLEITDEGGLTSADTCTITIAWQNMPPVAVAGSNQTVSEGLQVNLNGSGSIDPDDGIGSYHWTQIAGIAVLLFDPDSVSPTFTSPDVGPDGEALIFQLTVTDINGLTASDICIVNVTWHNLPPEADAGPDQSVSEGTQVLLNAAQSTDSDDGIAAYQWVQTEGVPVVLSDPAAVFSTFISPDVGPDGASLAFQLTVTDEGGLKSTDTCLVNVSWSNVPPDADAGPDQTVGEGAEVMLSGIGSSDPDDGIASYQWTQTAGPQVQLSDASAVAVSFVAPDIGPGGEVLDFELTVTDTGGLKSTDTVIVNIVSDNLPPVADAGLNRLVSPNDTVMLDGLNSIDPDGAIAAYAWQQINGPTVILSPADAVRPTFTAPAADNIGEALVFELTVSDHGGLQDIDTVVVNVYTANVPPVAMAGGLQTATSDGIITLTGSGSYDPDGSIVAYHWRQLHGPTANLSDPLAANPTFSVPDSLPGCGSLAFELTVTDNFGSSDTATAIVNISDSYLPPVAESGSDLIVEEGDSVTLDATNSYAPDYQPITYAWKQIDGPQVILSNPTASKPTFIAPDVDTHETELVFQLTVKDTRQLCGVSEISVFVRDNGIPYMPPDTIALTTYDNQRMSIRCNQNASLVNFKSIDPQDVLDSNNRPANLIYGLMDIQIKVAKPGETTSVTLYLLEPAPIAYDWFKWDERNGWRDFGSHTQFNATRDQVTITLTDGGTGDDDNMADSIIIDPGGLGTPIVESSGGGGGCFIETVVQGLD